jgi:hypothetical protein
MVVSNLPDDVLPLIVNKIQGDGFASVVYPLLFVCQRWNVSHVGQTPWNFTGAYRDASCCSSVTLQENMDTRPLPSVQVR